MTRAIVWCGTLALGLHAAAGLAQSLPAAQAAGDAEAGWRAVAQCAEVGAAGRRHACLDDVLRRAGLRFGQHFPPFKKRLVSALSGKDVRPPAALRILGSLLAARTPRA